MRIRPRIPKKELQRRVRNKKRSRLALIELIDRKTGLGLVVTFDQLIDRDFLGVQPMEERRRRLRKRLTPHRSRRARQVASDFYCAHYWLSTVQG